MSMLSKLWRKNNVKDRIREQIDNEVLRLQSKIAPAIYKGANGKVTLLEAQEIAGDVVVIIKQIVDKVL